MNPLNENPPPVFPRELTLLAGQRVRITGFASPYNDAQKLNKLLLLRSPGSGCFFCNPPDITAVVFVRRRPKSPAVSLDGQPVTMEGTLHLWSSDLAKTNDASQFLFTLDDASAQTL